MLFREQINQIMQPVKNDGKLKCQSYLEKRERNISTECGHVHFGDCLDRLFANFDEESCPACYKQLKKIGWGD